MKKRIVAALLTTGMLASSLLGCGQQQASQQASEGTGTEQSTETTVEQESSEVKEEEVTTVTWVIRCDPQKDDDKVVAAMNEILREKYNLELNLISIPSGEYNEKPRLMITSGEDFDLMYTANFTNNFYDNVAMGAFLPLNDLLETEAAADLMAVYPKGIEGVATVGGTIYALPNYQIMYDQNAFYIQKDLADKYGLDYENIDYVTDVTDLTEFMDKVRDNEPDMFVMNEKNSFGGALFDTGCKVDTFGTVAAVDMDDDDYKVSFYFDKPEHIERLRLVNEFYKAGYVREDVATVTDNSADVKANRYAMTFTTGKPGGDVEYSTKQGEEYIMINKGNEPTMSPSAGASTMTAINVNSKNPEAAIKMYGVMWTDKELFNMFLFGLEGVHYNKVGENRVELIPDSGYNRSGYGWMLGNQFNAWLLPGQGDTVWEETEAINRSAEPSHLAGFVLDNTPIETELAQISSVKSEYDRQYIYTDDFDGWLKEYTDKLKAAGAQKVIDEVQKQIDAWRAANGK